MMRWGFILPDRLLFNACAEGIAKATFWKESFQQRRCIVPADAIFEWQEADKGNKKRKYEFVIPGQQPFGLAGVWKLWKNPKTTQWERTFAVVTGEPNELMLPIHDRMTTFLEPRDYTEYLSSEERPPIHLLRILPAEHMRSKQVEKTDILNRQMNLFDNHS